ncbi:MAG TPA: sulfite exporter TauE/SafE family protein [Bryobacteraceae bacterium]|nr:sulfite exporter TauE/SafE family protein [Bryobacteraceae bacterium]
MTAFEFTLGFGLGLAGSLHCVQMCGPIVLSYSLPLAAGGVRRKRLAAAHAAYHAGRLATYAMLGALAGLAGGAVGLVSRLAGIANGARIFAGAAMILAAVILSGVLPRAGLVQIERTGPLRLFSRAVSRLMLAPTPSSKFGLGLLLGFLPCGLVYAALLKAVETASAAAGALTMAAFGLGTATTLLLLGLASSAAGLRLGKWSNALAAASIAAMGVFLIWRGVMPPAPMSHGHHG